MKQENGKGMIKALILLAIMVSIIVYICIGANKNIKTQKSDSVVSNMMLIKGKCKVFNENRIRTGKSEDELIGTKLSSIGEAEEKNETEENKEDTEKAEENSNNQNIEDNELKTIIDEFKERKAISEEDYKKYYVLTDKNLEELKLDVRNEEGSYYLINYEANEVIITKGYEGKYKLSEIEEARKEK